MGIEITDVKIIGACRKHDTEKEYLKFAEEDIFCIQCGFNPVPETKVKGRVIENFSEHLLSLGADKKDEIVCNSSGVEGVGMSQITVRQLINILIELPMNDEVYARDRNGNRISVSLVHKKKDNEFEALFG